MQRDGLEIYLGQSDIWRIALSGNSEVFFSRRRLIPARVNRCAVEKRCSEQRLSQRQHNKLRIPNLTISPPEDALAGERDVLSMRVISINSRTDIFLHRHESCAIVEVTQTAIKAR
jgi:hypothetical protein